MSTATLRREIGATIAGPGRMPLAVAGLLDPAVAPPEMVAPRLVQTHISWIVLAGPCAYKIKKPVSLGFLDYSTLEKRRAACEREIVLNRRLCPKVYLGVVPVTEHYGQVELGGPGRVLDYAVWMRRLPEARMLDRLLERGEATARMVEAVADRLAAFHATAATGPGVDEYGTPEAVWGNAVENFDQTRPFIGRTIDARTWVLANWATRRFLDARRALFERRVAEGRVRDGHGDLHAASICMAEPLAIFDCIEFNDRFRCSDVAAEVAFLAMDLEFNDRRDLAATFVDRYLAASGDDELRELLPFYISYRAFVRGKVESFKLNEPEFTAEERAQATDRARRYFAVAAVTR